MWNRTEPLMPADPVRDCRWSDHHRSIMVIPTVSPVPKPVETTSPNVIGGDGGEGLRQGWVERAVRTPQTFPEQVTAALQLPHSDTDGFPPIRTHGGQSNESVSRSQLGLAETLLTSRAAHEYAYTWLAHIERKRFTEQTRQHGSLQVIH